MLDTHAERLSRGRRRALRVRPPAACRAAEFFTKYQDRVMFGKDTYEPSEYPYYWRVFETHDEYFDYYRNYHAFWKLYGMGLPDAVLKKLYYQNALEDHAGNAADRLVGWPLADHQLVLHRDHSGGFARQLDGTGPFRFVADAALERNHAVVVFDIDRGRLDGIVERHLRLDLSGQRGAADGVLRLVRADGDFLAHRRAGLARLRGIDGMGVRRYGPKVPRTDGSCHDRQPGIP